MNVAHKRIILDFDACFDWALLEKKNGQKLIKIDVLRYARYNWQLKFDRTYKIKEPQKDLVETRLSRNSNRNYVL